MKTNSSHNMFQGSPLQLEGVLQLQGIRYMPWTYNHDPQLLNVGLSAERPFS